MSSTTPPVPHGLVLQPFRALRFAAAPELASLTSPPYDVIDDDERAELEARSPHNVVRLILPREPEDGPSSAGGDRYTVAADLLRDWTAAGVLVRDREPALYVYEQTSGGHVSRGLLGGVGLARAEDDIVLPHENTMAGPVTDRLALLRATEADLEPIFLVYAGNGTALGLVADVIDGPPLVDVTVTGATGDEARHRLWAVTDPGVLAAVADDLAPRRATIADGHHRYATYLRYQEERHAAGDGAGPWDFGLAFLVDASAFGPEVHPIHRVVRGLRFDDAVARAGEGFAVRPVEVSTALRSLEQDGGRGAAFVLTDGTEAVLLSDPDPAALEAALPTDRSAAWRSLDVAVAHQYLIRQLWQLEDVEDVVDFAHDEAAAVRAAASSGGTALLLNATPVQAVAAVAEAGDRMPRKSTLFTPKPATGVVIRPLY